MGPTARAPRGAGAAHRRDDTLWARVYYLRCLARFRDYMEALGCDHKAAAIC